MTQQTSGLLRPMDPLRDLGAIADLIAEAFADEIDERGGAALRDMRWMARLSPLVWWLEQVDPSFQDTFNGFVWEEPAAKARSSRRIVGNVSLNRAPGNRRWWIICNVVVQAAYRGRGIGRRLTEAAIAQAHDLGAEGVVLQVHQDNPPALRLYTNLGFREGTGETDWRLNTIQSVALLEASGYRLQSWSPADGQAVYELARRITPLALQWIRPLRAQAYRPDWLTRLGQRIADLFASRRVYRLTAYQEQQVVAAMTVAAAFRRGEHCLDLLVHPDHAGRVEAALVSRALYMLAAIPSRPVKITVDKDHTAILQVLRDYGFEEGRTLLTLRKYLE